MRWFSQAASLSQPPRERWTAGHLQPAEDAAAQQNRISEVIA
jgi:hypothetical protein